MNKSTASRMMLLVALLIASAAMSFIPSKSLAANKPSTIYMFGLATSFNDSTVYLTEIQQVDSAWVDSKTEFLYARNEYSYQLRDYLTSKGFEGSTCITTFASTRKKAEKKYMALRKRYITGGRFNVNMVADADFSYKAIRAYETVETDENGNPIDEKQAKEKKKKEKKAKQPKGGRPEGMPPGGGPGGMPGGVGGPGNPPTNGVGR